MIKEVAPLEAFAAVLRARFGVVLRFFADMCPAFVFSSNNDANQKITRGKRKCKMPAIFPFMSIQKPGIPLLILFLLAASLQAQQEGKEATFGHLQADSVRDAWHAVLANDDEGRILCVWSERCASETRILSTILRPLQRTGFRTDTVSVEDSCEDVRPAAAFLGEGGILVAWQQGCGGRQSVRGRLLDRAGMASGSIFSINHGAYNAMMPAAGGSSSGEAIVAWQDYRNGLPDIYAQRFNAHGQPVGENIQINDDASRAMQGPPRVAADNGARFLLLWPDNRGDGAWKFYSSSLGDGAPTENLLVDSAQRKAMTTLAAALALPPDSALFAWKDYREGHSNIYLRQANVRTGEFGAALRLNDDTTDRWQRLVVLDSDGNDRVAACWEDHRNTENNQKGDIYLQWMRRDGRTVGKNRKVNTRSDRIPRKMPTLAMLHDGKLLVLWHQGNDGSFDLHGQWYLPEGEEAGASFCITCGE